jgi:hypothetical protein
MQCRIKHYYRPVRTIALDARDALTREILETIQRVHLLPSLDGFKPDPGGKVFGAKDWLEALIGA